MKDGEDVNDRFRSPVDDPVVAEHDLTQRGVSQLRDDSSGVREVGEVFYGGEHVHHQEAGILWRILRDEPGDGFEIVHRLRRPPYFSHLAILSLTSAWATVWPESLC